MAEIPWWGLPLIAAVFALVGAGVTLLVTARDHRLRTRSRKSRRWYAERKDAYVALMAAYERVVHRLRAGFTAGITQPDPDRYFDEVGPALMQVRLIASPSTRGAALAVHLVLEQLHNRSPAPGTETDRPFLELLGHVPLLMHEFEVAVREELGIDAGPPVAEPFAAPVPGGLRGLLWRPWRPPAPEKPETASRPGG
ncbi:hypothetical protein [Krasilnikovia sp. MM14-A1259]|uniref:hypothetical protein n=1 Tax=Krasilnikovia sp. MM14-A1259 TaxID=3373539 RepID=UPI0038116012